MSTCLPTVHCNALLSYKCVALQQAFHLNGFSSLVHTVRSFLSVIKSACLGPSDKNPCVQVPMAKAEGLGDQAILLQTFLGLGMTLGSLGFGGLAVSRSRQCMISSQYLLQVTPAVSHGKLDISLRSAGRPARHRSLHPRPLLRPRLPRISSLRLDVRLLSRGLPVRPQDVHFREVRREHTCLSIYQY